jgi:16S rRNA (uracil1498-N3)-methyltransferase
VTPRFFVDAPLAAGTRCDLGEEAAHHAVHVLRAKRGEPAILFNGRGGEYAARIASIERKRAVLEVLEHRPIERESPLRMALVQGVSSAERMDFTIRKAVELGVAEVFPVITARSVARPKGERAEGRRAHWQKVVISACEQCGRNRLPEVHPVVSFDSYRAGPQANKILLSPRAALELSKALPPQLADVALAAGPEAGFSEQEETTLQAAGFVAVRLGPRVLRTETAALAAIAALSALRGDF